jgi:Protein of unknown function (DUF2846)
MRVLTGACALLLFTSALFAEDQWAAARAAAGCGPNEAQFTVAKKRAEHPVSQPEAGKALVFVFDDPDTNDIELAPAITRWGVDGKWVGATDIKSYFFFPLEAGEHRLCTSRQSRFKSLNNRSAALTFETQPGKTYYFRTQPQGGGHEHDRHRLELVPVDPAEAQLLIAKAAYSTSAAK